MIDQKLFKKRNQYVDFFYFSCANARKNERDKIEYSNNCKSKIKIKIPIVAKGEALMIKEHSSECGKETNENSFTKNADYSQKIEFLINKLTELIKQNPTIKPTEAAKFLNSFPEYENITHQDLKHLFKKIRKDLDFNSSFYALKNKLTSDGELFLRIHRLINFNKD